ncbi:hypothetical protein HPB49_013709 [Dermacentor silvarum]|uniref:Uncharacterized protein n=1 Tax=Dermacentor silvarum TaxID=543639 RepID=A0ACB8CXL3_DERSI|nr:hypothetical protein HPB49_013709 [Dermacentor silvarum]
MSETRDEQAALPSGPDPPDGVRSPRSDGSSDSVFSADGDAILRGAELPGGGGEQGPPAGEVPTTVILPPADTVHSPPPSICGTSVSTVQPGSDQVITAAMRRIAEKQQQIMDLLFHPNSKIPNSQRSQIISWLSEIVQECSDVRAIAAHQSGRVDELRDQLRLERRPASGALLTAAQTACPIRTYAAAARLGMHMPPPSTIPPPTPAAPGDVPHTIPDLAVPPPRDFAPRRDHDFIMFLTPIAPSAAPARDVAALLKQNIDLVAEGVGDIRPRHTRFGLTVFSNEKESFDRLKSAIERNSVTCTTLSIKVAEKRHPHVRLSGVDPDIGAHGLIAAINARNPSLQLSPDTCKVRVSFRERSGNYTHVLEVDAAAFRSLMACGRLLIGWTSVAVREDVHIPSCTYCATYGHSKRGCPHRMDPSKARCTKCAGAHLAEECSIRVGDAAVSCAECRRAERESLHPLGDARCPILQERVARMRLRTNYG